MKLTTLVCWCNLTFHKYNKVLLQWSLSMVYCISIPTKCVGLLHFYCNKVWWSIAFLLQSTAMQVALDHAPMHCTAFHRQLLLHLSYNWPMEKKLAGAVLSNFRSQYFRYLAAKCDLNTPALCFGWAQIYTHPLQHLFKNWLKADSDSPFVFLSFLPLSKKLKHHTTLAINV